MLPSVFGLELGFSSVPTAVVIQLAAVSRLVSVTRLNNRGEVQQNLACSLFYCCLRGFSVSLDPLFAVLAALQKSLIYQPSSS